MTALHPACCWESVLVKTGEDRELRAGTDPETSEHNADCEQQQGQRGFQTLEQRKALVAHFSATAVSRRPRQALRLYPGLVSQGLQMRAFD